MEKEIRLTADLKDSGNYGLDDVGNLNLILIDYGMTKKLYERQWVPLAESGILPQITFAKCQSGGVEREIRTYGQEDVDIRCVACGKK